MSNNQIARILDAHGVPHFESANRIYADSMNACTEIFGEVVDMTNWPRRRLYDWLGY